MDNNKIALGTVYEDPDGIFKVVSVRSDGVEVESMQEDPNQGKHFIVPIEEALYFIENPYKG